MLAEYSVIRELETEGAAGLQIEVVSISRGDKGWAGWLAVPALPILNLLIVG